MIRGYLKQIKKSKIEKGEIGFTLSMEGIKEEIRSKSAHKPWFLCHPQKMEVIGRAPFKEMGPTTTSLGSGLTTL